MKLSEGEDDKGKKKEIYRKWKSTLDFQNGIRI